MQEVADVAMNLGILRDKEETLTSDHVIYRHLKFLHRTEGMNRDDPSSTHSKLAVALYHLR